MLIMRGNHVNVASFIQLGTSIPEPLVRRAGSRSAGWIMENVVHGFIMYHSVRIVLRRVCPFANYLPPVRDDLLN